MPGRRSVQMLPAVKDFLAPNGEWVLDFGQNITGVVHAKLDLPAGAQVRLRHAESLDENGNFYTGNLSFAKSEDTFRSAGQSAEYLPRFTCHGFRYLCVEGLPESQRDPAAFTACVLTTDLRRTGQFRCFDERVNQLQSNIQWSQQDNFLEVPTDCPQRSERLGWTGDIRAYGCTALFNSDAALFLKKWLRDLAADQGEDGAVPYVVPDVLDAPGQPVSTASFWGDSAVVLPWEIYMASGNHWLPQAPFVPDCDLAARETEAKKQALDRKTQKLEQDRLAVKEKQRQREEINTQYIHVKTELDSSDLQRHIKELEKAQEDLKRQMVIWQTEYGKRNQAFTHLTADWKEVLRGCDALPTGQTEALGERTKVSLGTFVQQKGAAVQAVAALTGKELSAIDLPDAEIADRAIGALDRGMVALQGNVDQDLREAAQTVTTLVEEQKSLQAGRQRYPESVTALRQALGERLTAQAQDGASVRMVAELWDVRDPDWRNAVEGYLNTQRYNLLVAEESYQAAAAIYNAVKDALHIHGVAVVDIGAIRRMHPERRPGSLAEEIVTRDADARLYADFLLGRVMKCKCSAH